MSIQWNNDSPIYLQLYHHVIARILEGNLKEGEALPSVRNVAAEYRLNPLTISKAYQLLQDEQLVEKQRGKGLYVRSGIVSQLREQEKDRFLNQEWPLVVNKIKRLSLSTEQLLGEIKEN